MILNQISAAFIHVFSGPGGKWWWWRRDVWGSWWTMVRQCFSLNLNLFISHFTDSVQSLTPVCIPNYSQTKCVSTMYCTLILVLKAHVQLFISALSWAPSLEYCFQSQHYSLVVVLQHCKMSFILTLAYFHLKKIEKQINFLFWMAFSVQGVFHLLYQKGKIC